ncbi:ASCH domain-containing protein [Cupriavidus sp. TMH.W2]|uniref:ASCH domain-containing protein n=1 Tax=Cupriavidus sp. TMH.W2 TaxID=3434465 RepID=UPI003D78993A
MKALSMRQPWVWLIARPDLTDPIARAAAEARGEIKDIENRTWKHSHRGRTLIHASKGMTKAEYEDVQDFLYDLHSHAGLGDAMIQLPPREELERGGVVGVADIVDCVHFEMGASPWHMEGQWGFHIVNSRPLTFVPCKGALGFFDIPADVAAHLRVIGAMPPTKE